MVASIYACVEEKWVFNRPGKNHSGNYRTCQRCEDEFKVQWQSEAGVWYDFESRATDFDDGRVQDVFGNKRDAEERMEIYEECFKKSQKRKEAQWQPIDTRVSYTPYQKKTQLRLKYETLHKMLNA